MIMTIETTTKEILWLGTRSKEGTQIYLCVAFIDNTPTSSRIV